MGIPPIRRLYRSISPSCPGRTALFGWRGDDIERLKFEESYDEANSAVILVEREDVDWFTVQHLPDHIHLDSIYLTDAWQRQGMGTRIIRGLIREATAARVPLRLITAKMNEARRLYERLGFTAVREDDFKIYLAPGAPTFSGYPVTAARPTSRPDFCRGRGRRPHRRETIRR